MNWKQLALEQAARIEQLQKRIAMQDARIKIIAPRIGKNQGKAG